MNPEIFFDYFDSLECSAVERTISAQRTPIALEVVLLSEFSRAIGPKYFIISITFARKTGGIIYDMNNCPKDFYGTKIDVNANIMDIVACNEDYVLVEYSHHRKFFGRDRIHPGKTFTLTSDELSEVYIHSTSSEIFLGTVNVGQPFGMVKIHPSPLQKINMASNTELMCSKFDNDENGGIEVYPHIHKITSVKILPGNNSITLQSDQLISAIGINELYDFENIEVTTHNGVMLSKINYRSFQLYKNLVRTSDNIIIPFSGSLGKLLPNFSIPTHEGDLILKIHAYDEQTININMYCVGLLRYSSGVTSSVIMCTHPLK